MSGSVSGTFGTAWFVLPDLLGLWTLMKAGVSALAWASGL